MAAFESWAVEPFGGNRFGRTFQSSRVFEGDGSGSVGNVTERGQTNAFSTPANLLAVAPSGFELLGGREESQTGFVTERTLVGKHGRRDVSAVPLLTEDPYTLRRNLFGEEERKTVPSRPDLRTKAGFQPGEAFECYDYGFFTVAASKNLDSHPGTGVWDAQTVATQVESCLFFENVVEVEMGKPKFEKPEAPEAPDVTEKRVNDSKRLFGMYLLEYMTHAGAIGAVAHPHTRTGPYKSLVSVITHGGITGQNPANFKFSTTDPVFCIPPLSLTARGKLKKTLDESAYAAVPHPSQIIVPLDKSTWAVGRNVYEYALTPVPYETIREIFSGLPREEFERAVSLCYIGTCHAEHGENQGVAVCLDMSLRK